MPQLFLKFTDENGSTQKIKVDGDRFVIGRHTGNDLSISNPKLSREHIEITRSGETFYADDLGSSNGTTLNTYRIQQPEALYDNDVLNLGGGIEISVEINHNNAADASAPEVDHSSGGFYDSDDADLSSPPPATPPVPQHSAPGGFEFGRFFLIAPLLLLFVLIVAGGAVLVFKGTQPSVASENNDDEYELTPRDSETDDSENDAPANKTPEPLPTDSSNPTNVSANSENTVGTDIPAPGGNSETNGQTGNANSLEKAAIGFMRRMARNDPSPILTARQVSEIQTKIDQLKNSSALASNIKNAKANDSALTSLAGSKNLKPQFLATAAITKLGSSSGNVLTTAQSMIEVLDKLDIQLGGEFADDGLITIAAYQQGVADEFLKMRNTIEKLAPDNPNVTSRQIRTIWFLRDKGKISGAEFEFALRFLAIGTITQNPKAFGVNAEELSL